MVRSINHWVLDEERDDEETSFAQSYDDNDCNKNDSVDNARMQILSYFIPEITSTPNSLMEITIVLSAKNKPGEGCCRECFKVLFKIGTRAKREEWLIIFEPEQLERDVPPQSEYQETFFCPDGQEQRARTKRQR